MPSIFIALEKATQLLQGHDNPRLDAEVLLAHLLQKPRSYLYTWPDQELDPDIAQQFGQLVQRRAAGEPVAHLTGIREFWSLLLKVTPDTLIPRPETELLVEHALALIPPQADWKIADLGTGSGAIALAIASERPNCHITATDRSAAALATAQHNAETLGIGNVSFIQGDWFTPLAKQRFQLIISNPPYIEQDDPHLFQGDVQFEPLTALASGEDGLDDVRELIANAPQHLETGGWLLLEHGFDQGERVQQLLRQHGFQQVSSHADLQGHLRISVGQR